MTVTLSGGHQKEIKLSRYIGSGALVVPAGGTGWREKASAGASISSCHDEVNALSVEGGSGGWGGVEVEWGWGWRWGWEEDVTTSRKIIHHSLQFSL